MRRRRRAAPPVGSSPLHARLEAVAAHPAAVALAAVAAVFLGTRLALLWRFPPFLDESLYATWAWTVHDDGGQRFIALANGKEPILPWLGAALMTLGVGPLTSVRLVSTASGVATMALAFVLGRRLGGTWTGIAATGLYAVLPYFVVHDVIGIYEPLLTALAMAALWLQIRLAEGPRLDLALLLGIVLGAGLLTKEAGLFALVLLPASLVCFSWRRPALPRRLAAWAMYVAVALAVTGLLYSIMKLSPLYAQLGHLKAMIEPKRSFHDALAHPLRWLSQMWPAERRNFAGYLTWPLIALLPVGAAFALRLRTRLSLLLLAWALLPIAGTMLIAKEAFVRYTLQAAPPLVLFMAFGLERSLRYAGSRLSTRGLRVASGVLAAGVLLLLVPAFILDGRVLASPDRAHYPGTSDYEYGNGWAAGNAWRAVAGELQRLAGGGSVSVSYYEQGSPALQLELRDHPNVAVLRGDSGSAQALNSRFVIENGVPIPPNHGPGVLRPRWEYRRPRGGVPLTLYERGVLARGRFYSTQEALRAGLGLPDRSFDAFVAGHPAVKAWYDGQSAAARAG